MKLNVVKYHLPLNRKEPYFSKICNLYITIISSEKLLRKELDSNLKCTNHIEGVCQKTDWCN